MNKIRALSDEQIVTSWKNNVKPWVAAIKNDEIASRLLVTNQAILSVLAERNPKTVLDVGCGEGWLVRELAEQGVDALGIDAVPGFIEYASKAGKGRFKSISYESLSADVLNEKFDIVVCNFSLLGKDSVTHVFRHVSSILEKNGLFIVQTIHPIAGCGDSKYEDGWREGSWDGFSKQFCDPAPWYFRTLEAWKALYIDNGFDINEVLEPINPETDAPSSVIFVGVLTDE
ncbi:MAG: class I SAM-dependent methyltransferase [Gammaproteobacteria bacterium]|nr:class I SAM-dependent methyltransferase [Gammaproteobacteria bacterium]